MNHVLKIKIDGTDFLTDESFKLIKDKKFGDYYLKQTPNSTSILTYSKEGLDKAVPLIDNKAFIDGCRKFLSDNQGLVEVVNTKTKKGNICAYSIIKEAIKPFGMMYILTIQVAYEDFIINVHGEFKEEGMTGERDNLVAILYEKAGKLKFDEIGRHGKWFEDPYDKKYAKGVLMNLSELPQFDKIAPNHPLSEARKVVDIILKNN